MAKRIKTALPRKATAAQYVELGSWREFYRFINENLPSPHDYIFRGQRSSSWKLESSLDRNLRNLGQQANSARLATQHYNQFRLAIRGRRGVNPKDLREIEQWALGQHYGLWTPLLDWTESPFAALYFAFEDPDPPETGQRAVFALCRPLVRLKSVSIAQKQVDSAARPDIIEIITPMTDENPRLVSQGGLFTRCTFGVDIETWVNKHFRHSKVNPALIKVIIPEREDGRLEILRTLNRMNINHRSLFPDVSGSAEYCNMRLSIKEY